MNRGPHRPERCALPGCATPREERIVAEGGGMARRGCPTLPLLWRPAGLKAMRMRRIRLLMVVVLAALFALPAAACAYLPPGFVGMSPQNSLGHKDFELMREAGVDSVRLPMFWMAIETKSPLVVRPDWSLFDKEVELAAEDNIRIMPFVWGSPEWIAPEALQLPVKTSWQRWAWQRFLREAERRYGPEGEFWEDHTKIAYLPITHWEIWNEENIVTQAAAPLNPAEYATLIRISGRGRSRLRITRAPSYTRWTNGSVCSICICVSTESGCVCARIPASGFSLFWVLIVSGVASTFSLAVAR